MRPIIKACKQLFLLPAACLLYVVSCQKPSQALHPNILIILADDLGYGDLKSYNPNSWIPTPHLDQLASEGIRLTHAYCPVSVCTPSRYALMTGQYAWRSWKKTGVMSNYEPSMIEADLITLPEMLQQSGYATAGFGKWHLGTSFPTLDGNPPAGYGQFRADDNGANLDLSRPVTDGPLAHGFDHWYGFSCASECWILYGNEINGAIGHDLYTIEATPNKDHIEVIPLADYLPQITDRAIAFLEHRSGSEKDRPFFLYFAPYVPHIPLAVSEEFRGRTRAGLYGDYVHELDHYVGQILQTLEDLNMKDNTIVLFASDNGSQFTVSSSKWDMAQATNSPRDVSAFPDSLAAHRPNGPLRGTKWSIYEGGVRTPFIARWPGHFPESSTSDDLFALNDLMATLASIVGYDLPEGSALDSKDQIPVLTGVGEGPREEVIVQSSGRLYGIIQGHWKFIEQENSTPQNAGENELYDLSTDPSESVNLSRAFPEKARALKECLENLLSP